MKNLKFILPMSVIAFTLAVSFASVTKTEHTVFQDELALNDGVSCEPTDLQLGTGEGQIPCEGVGNFDCQVSIGGTTFTVYEYDSVEQECIQSIKQTAPFVWPLD